MQNPNPHEHSIAAAITEHTTNICFAFNVRDQKFEYLNASFEYFFNLIPESVRENARLIQQSLYEDDMDFAIETYQKLLTERFVNDVVLRIKHPGTELKILKLQAWLLDINDTQYIAGIAADITKEMQQLAVLNKFAEKKNSILEILSHDLTAPLGNIQMCATLIKSGDKDFNSLLVADLLDKIIVNSERGLKLIREFLKKEFLETYSSALIKMRIDIVARINNFIDEFKNAESQLNKTVLVAAQNEALYVYLDEPKFIQVLQNLVSNAMKFTPDGGIIQIKILDKNTDVLIVVEDNGIGIPEHLQKNIFQKFSQAGRSGLKGEKSIGLGMSIVKRIVEWHNGRIWLESEENKGTSFYVQIPKDL